ncbi:MAG: hypothetical protein WC140_04255 [Bacteroidales bacterium]
MQNKLQELTNKLYSEGLSKGKKEAEEMKLSAKKEANTIISEATEKAKTILASAKKEAEELKTKTSKDTVMATTQTISSVKQQIESLIIAKAIQDPIKANMLDTDFLSKLINTLIEKFEPNNEDNISLNLLLPENMKDDFQKLINNKVIDTLNKGLEIKYSKNITNGFKIGPANQGYMLNFTSEDFEALFAEYLRPNTRKLLFG